MNEKNFNETLIRFNKVVKEYKKKNGMTQLEVGALLGYNNQGSFSQVLNGHIRLTEKAVKKMSDLSGVPLSYFYPSDQSNVITGNNNIQHAERFENSNGNTIIKGSEDMKKILDRLDLLHEQIKTKDEQIDRLITVIEKLHK